MDEPDTLIEVGHADALPARHPDVDPGHPAAAPGSPGAGPARAQVSTTARRSGVGNPLRVRL